MEYDPDTGVSTDDDAIVTIITLYTDNLYTNDFDLASIVAKKVDYVNEIIEFK